jgi:hypothetical protein
MPESAKPYNINNLISRLMEAARNAPEILKTASSIDTIFSSRVLGYIPLAAFFARVSHALVHEGRFAVVIWMVSAILALFPG